MKYHIYGIGPKCTWVHCIFFTPQDEVICAYSYNFKFPEAKEFATSYNCYANKEIKDIAEGQLGSNCIRKWSNFFPIPLLDDINSTPSNLKQKLWSWTKFWLFEVRVCPFVFAISIVINFPYQSPLLKNWQK